MTLSAKQRQQLAIAALIEVQHARAHLDTALEKIVELCRDIGITHPAQHTIGDARRETVRSQMQLEALTERVKV